MVSHRDAHSLFEAGAFSNRTLCGATAISFALVALVMFVLPIAAAFGLTQLSVLQYLLALAASFVPVIVMEIARGISRLRKCLS